MDDESGTASEETPADLREFPAWSFAWARPRYNAICCGLALVPLGYWRHAIHTCAVEQSTQAAFGLSFLALAGTALLDRWRHSWPCRIALWLALLGLATTPAALTGALAFLTGATL